jgi:hypothetical protein
VPLAPSVQNARRQIVSDHCCGRTDRIAPDGAPAAQAALDHFVFERFEFERDQRLAQSNACALEGLAACLRAAYKIRPSGYRKLPEPGHSPRPAHCAHDLGFTYTLSA